MKKCPQCGSTWPDSGRFCPMDGAALEDAGPTSVTTPAPAAPQKPEAQGPKPAVPVTDKKKFSDTQWFLLGDSIEDDALTPEETPVEELEKKYKKTSELPTDVRRKYSLEYGEEGGPKKNG